MRRLTFVLSLLAALLLASTSAHAERDLPEQLLDLWDHEDYFATLTGAVQDSTLADDELADLAGHPDWRVRTQASIILLWRTDADLFETVWTARTYRGRRGRILRFAEPLMETAEAAPALLERLLRTDEPAKVRVALVKLLVTNGHAEDNLIGLMGAIDDPEVRLHVVHGFRRTSLDQAVAGLTLALQDPSPVVRAQAADSIGWRPDGAVMADALLGALDDPEEQPRAMVARALGWHGVEAAVEPLTLLLADEAPAVRLHALRSLDRIDSEVARRLPALDALTRDPDSKVSRVAKRIAQSQ